MAKAAVDNYLQKSQNEPGVILREKCIPIRRRRETIYYLFLVRPAQEMIAVLFDSLFILQ
jgi:hypothetical protein